MRFYVDADVLGLAKLLVQVRSDVTFPGDKGGLLHRRLRPPCQITDPRTPDRDWIPQVAAQGWLIITRDSNISAHRAEIAAVLEYNARMVALAAHDAQTTFEQLELLTTQWRPIEQLLQAPGPFIYTATRSSLHRIELS